MLASDCPTGNPFERLIGAAMTRHYRRVPYSQGCYRSGSGQEEVVPCRRNVSRAIDSGTSSKFESDPFSEIM
jgi:hypothetical protein